MERYGFVFFFPFLVVNVFPVWALKMVLVDVALELALGVELNLGVRVMCGLVCDPEFVCGC